jgi:hypothetical protein
MTEQLTSAGGGHPRARAARKPLRQRHARIGAAIALVTAAGLIAWVVVSHTGSSTSRSASADVRSGHVGPMAVSPAALKGLSNAFREPIYWMGPKRGFTYELTRTSDGKLYVRYLPRGVRVGVKGSEYTIIVTYPFPGSFAALENAAHGHARVVPGGGIALVDPRYAKSVHVSFPGVGYQVEVYDPSPARSLRIALSGDVRPVR